MYKSEQLAHNLKQLILEGNLKPQQKLPSLRDQVQLSGFSLMTVMNAYHELQSQGLIYTKEKSGYFVTEHPIATSRYAKVALNSKIEINSLVFKYLKSTQAMDILPLGSAFPNHQLLFHPKLNQILAQQARAPHPAQLAHLPPGHLALRRWIAQRYTLQGIPTSPDDIVITSGALDALNLALQAITQTGDYIVLQQTIFYGAWQAAERLGLKVITIPDHPQHGIDLDAFKQVLANYPIKVCWLMLNCHNPLGFTVSDEIKMQLADLLVQHQVYLIEDDVYEEMFYGTKKPHAMKYFDQKNWVLHCSSFSKTLGANFRVGWVHAGKFSQCIQHLQLMSTLSVNPLIQSSLVEFLQHHHYEKHLRRLRRNLEQYKRQFYLYLKHALPSDCEVIHHLGGYFLWIRLPENVDSMHIYQHLMQHNIAIAPSQLFNILAAHQQGLRINCSFAWNAQIQQALDQLIQIIYEAMHSSTASLKQDFKHELVQENHLQPMQPK